jgi:glutamate carboxypeptidase
MKGSLMLTDLDQTLKTFIESRLPPAFDLLRRMVEINTFTANPAGVNALGQLTADIFGEHGFSAETVQSSRGHYGRHLFLTRKGSGSESVGLVSHLDTVFSPEEELENQFHWRQEGDRIYGPGTVDIKGGTIVILLILEALQACAPEIYERVNWKVFLDGAEEDMSEDFAAECLRRLDAGSRACLVFEGGTPAANAMTLVTARKGRASFILRAGGRGAHAGNYHALGANAIVQMAHTILQVAALTDYTRRITFNVGTVRGGSVINRVPHLAEAGVEMRAHDPQVFADGVAKMLALHGTSHVAAHRDGYRSNLMVELTDQTAPWPRNDSTERLFRIWKQTGAELGLKVEREERGGLSDGNHLWRHVPTLDGLGPEGANAHCSERSPDGSKDQEYALASSFAPRAWLSAAALIRLLA